jgi:membrane protein YqaA with SNARE-associated domain
MEFIRAAQHVWARRRIIRKACAAVKQLCHHCPAFCPYSPPLIMDASLSLWALFASSFLAATLLPGGSEAVLFGVIKMHPGQLWAAIAVASLGNTLGGLSSYVIGRVLPQKNDLKGLARVRRYGAPVLVLSWVPIIGDPLCVAAGWLRLNAAWCLVWVAIGKFTRYVVIAALAA